MVVVFGRRGARRRGPPVIGGLAVVGLVFALAASARVGPKVDLVESSLSNPPAHVRAGSSFKVVAVVVNRGSAPAPKSLTRFVLRAGKASWLAGSRRVPRLKAHKSSRASVLLRVPRAARATVYSLVACADAGQAVREQNERNNCRTAHRHVVVLAAGGGVAPTTTATTTTTAPAPADSDGDGTPNAQDCAPNDASIHPGAPDLPDLSFVDSNCDGIDGTAANAIFVSPNGTDANPGTMDKPMRQIQAAVLQAVNSRKDVYVAAGSYTHVAAETGVGIYGGYDPKNWSRASGNTTVIAGSPEAILVDDSKAVVIQLVSANGSPGPGVASAYGIRAVNGSSLTLQNVTITAAAGSAGTAGANGVPGIDGMAGTDGAPGQCDDTNGAAGGHGGSSPAGMPGGDGGNGGNHAETGNDGAPGATGGGGTRGGAGGATGSKGSPGGIGDEGADGAPGRTGSGGTSATPNAAWAGQNGVNGTNGRPGNGGGGGGGGGGQAGVLVADGNGNGGGGGGGGATAGTLGGGGSSGGGSFGIYLFASTLAVESSSITAGNGGVGGRGGNGGVGGAGGAPGRGGKVCLTEVGAGGDGGGGGNGGTGGGGGGGQGGPSLGIFKVGTSTATVSSSTIKVGTGGPGGAGGVGGLGTPGPGQNGVAQGIYP